MNTLSLQDLSDGDIWYPDSYPIEHVKEVLAYYVENSTEYVQHCDEVARTILEIYKDELPNLVALSPICRGLLYGLGSPDPAITVWREWVRTLKECDLPPAKHCAFRVKEVGSSSPSLHFSLLADDSLVIELPPMPDEILEHALCTHEVRWKLHATLIVDKVVQTARSVFIGTAQCEAWGVDLSWLRVESGGRPTDFQALLRTMRK